MQLFQDPSGTGQIFRSLVILHQLFNDRRINPRLLAFLALFFSLLLLGHFHLLSQVVTHTQNFPTPSRPLELRPRSECMIKPSFSAVVCSVAKRHKSMANCRAALTTKRRLAPLLRTKPAAN